MKLQFFNSYSRKKENFLPINNNKIGLYTCGPTVYDFSHIGNFRTFVFEDILKRWLIHLGYDVNHIMNITDVDDKTIKKAKKEGVELKVLTERYTSFFIEDLKWLKIKPANKYPRATDYIEEMKNIIQILIDKKFAYAEKDGSVYFDIKSFPKYGILTNLKINKKEKAIRTKNDEYEKESIHDFALWKGWKEEDGEVVWDAPWGKGRPGWHIECSAMSCENLGNHFDIHCGGVDNIFPHHENEIAQSICSTGSKFVNYWLHSEFLLINGSKMSKSLGNFYTLRDLRKKGFSPETIRFQLSSGHYRTKISFSINKKHESDKIVNRVNEFHTLLIKNGAINLKGKSLPRDYDSFKAAMNDDLNTPRAIAIFLKWMKNSSKTIKSSSKDSREIISAWNFLMIFNSIFCFIYSKEILYPEKIKILLSQREKARKEKKWDYADLIRNTIKEEGWLVEDTEDGQKLKRI